MPKLGLKTDDVVTDIDPESSFHEIQGQVVRIQYCFWDPPEVLVRFDRELFPEQFDILRPDHEDTVYEIYELGELRKDKDWEPEVHARRLFGNRYHTINTLRASLDPGKPCMVDECPHNQDKVIWVNICGSVCNVYVCDEHARHFQTWSCMDAFPWRQVREKVPVA